VTVQVDEIADFGHISDAADVTYLANGRWEGTFGSIASGFGGEGQVIVDPIDLRYQFQGGQSWKTAVARMRFSLSALPAAKAALLLMHSGGNKVWLQLMSSGQLVVTTNSSTGTEGVDRWTSSSASLVTDTEYYVEFGAHIDPTSGAFSVRIDGTLQGNLTQSNVNTSTAGAVHLVNAVFAGNLAGLSTWEVAGSFGRFSVSVGNDQLEAGDLITTSNELPKIATLYAYDDGALLEWDNGTGDGFEQINEIQQDNNTTYIAAKDAVDAGKRSSYLMDPKPGSASVIYGVKVNAMVAGKLSGSNIKNTRLFQRMASTNYDSPNLGTTAGLPITSSPTVYGGRSYIWLLNPDTGLPWTSDDTEALEVGVRAPLTSDAPASQGFPNGAEIRCTQIVVELLYGEVAAADVAGSGSMQHVAASRLLSVAVAEIAGSGSMQHVLDSGTGLESVVPPIPPGCDIGYGPVTGEKGYGPRV
jgi:hypothetical protein